MKSLKFDLGLVVESLFHNHVVRANLQYCRHHHGNHRGYDND